MSRRTVPLSVKISKETSDLLDSYSKTMKVLDLNKSKLVEEALRNHLLTTLAPMKQDIDKRMKGFKSK